MANKFTQSVLERQYKEAQDEKRAKKQAIVLPVEENPEPPAVQALSAPAVLPQGKGKEAAPVTVKKAAELQVETVQPVSINLDAYIIKETERVAKNKTFYLDQAVIDAVKAGAKRQRITDSKLVNDILRKVLAVGS